MCEKKYLTVCDDKIGQLYAVTHDLLSRGYPAAVPCR